MNSRIKEVSQILNNKNPTSVIIIPTKEVVEETEAGTRTGTSTLDKSGSKEMGTEAEGAEDGEDAGQPHHQADHGLAPRHEQLTICSIPIPTCFFKASREQVFSQYTK